jgi:DNA-binding HxlR family transcriptional regulator
MCPRTAATANGFSEMAHGLVEKFTSDEVPIREAYRLTEKGRSLIPVVEAMDKWGLANIPGTQAKMKAKPTK